MKKSTPTNSPTGSTTEPIHPLYHRIHPHNHQDITMNFRTSTLAASIALAALFTLPGCAVTRDQETVGAYVDDSAITTAVKAKFVTNKTVDASAISVETLNGTVMLSGFAKSDAEKMVAESLTRDVKGVKSVKNGILVRG
jgi:hyperosmotically inducible periplasmic protein